MARKYMFLFNSTKLEAGPDGLLVRPIWQLRGSFEEAAPGFLQESCESLWVAGVWDCNTALERLWVCSQFPSFPTMVGAEGLEDQYSVF